MSAPLPFTGERFTPETAGAIWYEHWHRYCAVRRLAAGKRVLDCACGEGYGSMLLAGVASSVIGVDVDGPTIRHAVSRYSEQENLRFTQASCTKLPLPDGSVDLLVSFETIEHLSDQEAMLAEFARVLGRNGVLVISSPNKHEYRHASDSTNHFHIRELTRDELASRLGAHFPQQTWYGQRVLAHSLLWTEVGGDDGSCQLVALTNWRVDTPAAPAAPVYFVVVCGASDVVLPQLPALSLFDDGAQSLYRDYERALLAEKRLYWDKVNAEKIAAERAKETVAAVDEMTSARRELEAQISVLQNERSRLAGELDETTTRLRDRESWPGWVRWPLGKLRRLLLPNAARVSE